MIFMTKYYELLITQFIYALGYSIKESANQTYYMIRYQEVKKEEKFFL